MTEQKTLKENAQAYQPPQKTKNIAELTKIPLDAPTYEQEVNYGKDEQGTDKIVVETFMDLNGETYRVPKSVLKDIKTYIEEITDLTHVKVIKKGKGMETTYTVVPLPTTA